MEAPFHRLESKIQWLLKHINKLELSAFEMHAKKLVKNHCRPELQERPRVADLLSLDMVYCILRHRVWVNAKMFSHLLSVDLSSSFGLSQKTTGALVESFLEFYSSRESGSNCGDALHRDDQQFILYLTVSFLSDWAATNPANELGFGPPVTNEIAKALGTANEVSEGEGSYQYGSLISHSFVEAVTQVKTLAAENPWALEHYLLDYRCGNIFQTDSSALKGQSGDAFFKLLTFIGMSQFVKPTEMRRFLQSKGAGDSRSLSVDQFIEIGLQAEVIYCESSGRSKRYALTDQGLRLTGRYFARSHQDAFRDFDRFLRLDPLWQQSCIRYAWENLSSSLLLMSLEEGSLDPCVSQMVLRRLRSSNNELPSAN